MRQTFISQYLLKKNTCEVCVQDKIAGTSTYQIQQVRLNPPHIKHLLISVLINSPGI